MLDKFWPLDLKLYLKMTLWAGKKIPRKHRASAAREPECDSAGCADGSHETVWGLEAQSRGGEQVEWREGSEENYMYDEGRQLGCGAGFLPLCRRDREDPSRRHRQPLPARWVGWHWEGDSLGRSALIIPSKRHKHHVRHVLHVFSKWW